jgi:hypothetical protein
VGFMDIIVKIRDLKVLIIFQNKQEGLVDAICPQMVLQCDSLEPGLPASYENA